MEYIKLVNDISYPIDEQSTAESVAIAIQSTSEIPAILDEFTDANLETVYFINEEETYGIYKYLHLDSATIQHKETTEVVDGQEVSSTVLQVVLHLTKINDVNQRLNELDAAIVELAELIAGE